MNSEKELTDQIIQSVCLNKLDKEVNKHIENIDNIAVGIALYQLVMKVTLLPTLRYEA